ncbi:MAG: hypothetical protein OEW35_18900 [Gammaproteobacteria bacterium]|nr:hypothetical protein [Gammaproteobacteria bacterium]MDH5311368.1 hypothetical protein [Gammaproteobacteria bacterium]
MNKHLTRVLAVAGFALALAAPAHAHPDNFGFVVRLDPAHRVDRHYDGARHHDRDDRDWHKPGKKHRKLHRRLEHTHDRWHRHNDGRRDRYYYRDHRALHFELGFGHYDFHYGGHRHH